MSNNMAGGDILLAKIGNIDDANKVDVGVMINNGVSVDYAIVATDDLYEVYLYDDEKNVLIKGVSKYLAHAKRYAVQELNKIK